MAEEQRKSTLKAIRLALCNAIGGLTKKEIVSHNENKTLLEELIHKVAVDAAKSTKRSTIDMEIIENAVRSVIGNMQKCAKDLNMELSEEVLEKFKEFDFAWRVEKERTKRARNIDTQFCLSKRVRTEQARHAQIGEAETLPSTLRNSECSLTVGIPHDAIVYKKTMGQGSYGECHKVEIKGISFFPEGIVYAAKKYKGAPGQRLKSFEREIGVDLIHRGIVRSIAHTRCNPWVAIFPLFNGPCLGEIMQSLHYDKGTFKRIVKKISGGGIVRDKGKIPEISELHMSRIRAFCEHAPDLIHAMVQSMAFAHEMGVVHCDLHPFNVMLDFTREHHPRVGIIDWGLALRVGFEKRKSLHFLEKDHVLRPWLAPELLDKENDQVYSEPVDVYALSWLILQICIFCSEFSVEHKMGWETTLAASQCDHIKHIVGSGYLKKHGKRGTFSELANELERMQLQPSRCLRPIIEMMPAFY